MSICENDIQIWCKNNKEEIIKFVEDNFHNHDKLELSVNAIKNSELYIPRVVYGEYLKYLYHNICSKLNSINIEVNLHNAKILELNQEIPKNNALAVATGHQLPKEEIISPYPAQKIYNKLDEIYHSGKFEIDIHIDGTSLSALDAIFSINTWLHIKNDDKIRINLELHSRTYQFATTRMQNIPTTSLNYDKLYLDAINDYSNLSLNDKLCEEKILNIYIKYVNIFRKELNQELLKYEDIFTPYSIKDVSTLSNHLNQTNDQQIAIRLASNIGAFLYKKMDESGIEIKTRTTYLNKAAPIPQITVNRLNEILVNPSFCITFSNIQKSDLKIDATQSVKRSNENLLKYKPQDNIFESGTNKFETSSAMRSGKQGYETGNKVVQYFL